MCRLLPRPGRWKRVCCGQEERLDVRGQEHDVPSPADCRWWPGGDWGEHTHQGGWRLQEIGNTTAHNDVMCLVMSSFQNTWLCMWVVWVVQAKRVPYTAIYTH